MQLVIEAARLAREKMKISFKQPVMSLTVLSSDTIFLKSISHLQAYLKKEINCDEIIFDSNVAKFLIYKS